MTQPRALASLLAREVRASWPVFAVWLPLCPLQAMAFLMWSEEAYRTYLVGSVLLCALAGPAFEHRYRVEPLFASLPLSRRTLVAARYLWCALCILFGLALAAGGTWLGAALGVRAASPIGAARSVVFLAATGLPLFLFLPFHFRWGLGGGALRFCAAAAAVAALAGVLLGLARRPGAAATAWLSGLLGRLVATLGAAPALLLTVALLLALGLASARLSALFYARREL